MTDLTIAWKIHKDGAFIMIEEKSFTSNLSWKSLLFPLSSASSVIFISEFSEFHGFENILSDIDWNIKYFTEIKHKK